MAANLYNEALKTITNGTTPAEDGDIGSSAGYVAALVTSGYTFDPTHDTYSSLTNECSGTGYAIKELTGVTITVDDVNDRITVDCDDLTWTSADFGTPARLIIMSTVSSPEKLIACIDIAAPVTTNATDYVIQIHSSGLFRISNV